MQDLVKHKLHHQKRSVKQWCEAMMSYSTPIGNIGLIILRGHVRCTYHFIHSAPIFCHSTVKYNVNQIWIIWSTLRFGSSTTIMNDTFSEVPINFPKCIYYNLTRFLMFSVFNCDYFTWGKSLQQGKARN